MPKQLDRRAFSVRVPTDIKEWLESRAEENGRSLNNEIVQILRAQQKQGQAA